MSEWWTYTFSDFLLFSPRTYYRTIERYNGVVWPGHIATVGLGVAILALLGRPAAWRGRTVFTILATLWAWVAWAFLARRYAAINWAAVYFAWLFALQALLLILIGAIRGAVSFRPRRDTAGVLGIGLLVLSVGLYPMLAPILGRGWRQAEVFGMVPDPTAIATLGLLLLAEGSRRWILLVVPLIWCAVSGATLWAMGSPETWLLLLAAALVVGTRTSKVTTITAVSLPHG
ncbi:MAG: MFS transporter permease [Gemmatimonadales bacterium]|nr:MFS transporter permease [Gemmatimonadales bacterium]